MGLSARYMGASVKASLDSETSAEKLTVTASFIQNAFTIGIEAPSSPKDWFSADFTEAKLQDQLENNAMGPDNLPVYVSDVTYGRIIMISFTSSASESDIKASLEATYNGGFWGGELSIDGDRQEILKESELSIQQMGPATPSGPWASAACDCPQTPTGLGASRVSPRTAGATHDRRADRRRSGRGVRHSPCCPAWPASCRRPA